MAADILSDIMLLSPWQLFRLSKGVGHEKDSGLRGDFAGMDGHSMEVHGGIPTATAAPFHYSGDELESLLQAENYLKWIVSYLAPYVGRRALEVGAGIGNLAECLLGATHVEELVLIEPASNLFPTLAKRFEQNSRVRTVHGDFRSSSKGLQADTVILVNVLEHIEDDRDMLTAIQRFLPVGGTLLLYVPALPWLFGTLDRAFGHFRRYMRLELRAKLENAGFRIERLRYFNLPGVASWFLAGKVLRQRTIRPGQVRLYDRLVVPWASRLERIWEPPFGQGLVAVARKQQ